MKQIQQLMDQPNLLKNARGILEAGGVVDVIASSAGLVALYSYR